MRLWGIIKNNHYLSSKKTFAMRFCPKCSLRIKANIEQCPICKVELLSCAEDEVAASESMQDKHPVNTESSAGVCETANPTIEELSPTVEPAGPPSPPPQPAVGNADLAQAVEQLSSKLESIEQNLGLITGKDEVIKKSIVDIESKLNKLEKQIIQLQAVPLDRFEALEKEVAQKIIPTTSASIGDLEAPEIPPVTRGNIETLKSLSDTIPPHPFSADEQSFSDEEASFPRDDTDSFSSSFQGSDATFDKNAVLRPQREPKKGIPLLIPLLALAMIVVWLLFYYSRPKQPVQTEIVTEQITPQAAPVQTRTPVTEQKTSTPEVTKEISGETRKKSENPLEATEKSPSAAKEPPAKKSLFTVNVGSFKDKNLATALTTRLRDNGYTALMSQSEQNNFYRVRVGAFSTIEEARTFAFSLQKKEKLPTFVTRLEQP
jgi:cell division septation protein DedD